MRKRFDLHNFLLIVIFIAFISLVFFGIYHHEPWRDEAHAWMIAREVSVPDIINNIQDEGVPSLWYLMLKPFARLGFPYETMNILHGILAVIAVGMLLFKTRIPFLLKVLIPFSYFIAYEYAVVARNYVMTALFLYSIAVFYPKRFKQPLLYALPIGLLYHVNLHSVGFAAALTLLYLYELLKQKKLSPRYIVSLTLMLASGVFSVITLVRGPMQQSIVPASEYNLMIYSDVLRGAIVPALPYYKPVLFNYFPPDFILQILTYLLIASILIVTYFNRQIFVLTCMMIGWLFYINVYVHPAELRHRGLFLLLIIFLFILSEQIVSQEKLYRAARSLFILGLAGALLLSTLYTKYIFQEDYTSNFTGAKDMAEYIQSNGLDSRMIISFYSTHAEAILPYFRHKAFYEPEYGKEGFFQVANINYAAIIYGYKVTMWDAIVKAKEKGSDGKYPLLLLSEGLPESQERYFTRLYASFQSNFWENSTENFWLYEYNGSLGS